MSTASGENKLKLSLTYLGFLIKLLPGGNSQTYKFRSVMEESKHAVWPVPVGITI